ncbi:MAG: acyl-CoA dehydrogenase [Betaproteobacteria bacterium]
MADAIARFFARDLAANPLADLGSTMTALVGAGLDRLPVAGGGATLERWRALSRVGAHDLSLVKLYEGHTDALAIMCELHAPRVPACSIWGMWAAEPPTARLRLRGDGNGRVRVDGRKAWCSGASMVSHGLVTAWNEADEQCLVAVDLAQPTITIDPQPWKAIGMGASGSVDVVFADSEAYLVGAPGDYTSRPGFWQGGIGVAACWYGAATALAAPLRASVGRRTDPHSAAHLGAVDVALGAAAAVLREAARQIDQRPGDRVQGLALRAREAVADNASLVLTHVTRALGAGPLCRDAHIAQLVADLPVFMRQSHAERDLEQLGLAVATSAERNWKL